MTATVYSVYLLAADGTIDCQLFQDTSRRVSEKAARRFRDQYEAEIKAGQVIQVREERVKVDATDFYPDDEDAFWEAQYGRQDAEDAVAVRKHLPSEY